MPNVLNWPRHRLSGPARRSECVHIDRDVAATWIPLTYIRQMHIQRYCVMYNSYWRGIVSIERDETTHI